MLIRDALDGGQGRLNGLEKEGVIRRFEYTFELSRKQMKDYLEATGFVFATIIPRQVIKDAYAGRILPDGQVWIDKLDYRSLLSHTYDPAVFDRAVDAIPSRFLAALSRLHGFMHREFML